MCVRNFICVVFLYMPLCFGGHDAVDGMVWIEGGEFDMGSDEPMFTDARPIHRVRVHDFWMDATEVTNTQFARFVRETGYTTVAERPLDPKQFPNLSREDLTPGSVVFAPPPTDIPLDEPSWWQWVSGANWRHPQGPKSDVRGRDDHPVVHIAYEDALAYAKWAGKQIPTEAEWEWAARGGLEGKAYVWGDQFRPSGRTMANTFQGQFPHRNTAEDGYLATSPVKAFPANGFGLYGMAGNVWEWTADWYRPDYYTQLTRQGKIAVDPQGPSDSVDPGEPGVPKKVQKGGSFLCTDQYCARYRPGARGKGAVDSGANHVGFRLLRRPVPEKREAP
jgi:formylglycine-generating enzyme